MSKLKGYIFKQKGTSRYFNRFCCGSTAVKANAHVYTVAEALECYSDDYSMNRSGGCKSIWGCTPRGKWIAVWEKS